MVTEEVREQIRSRIDLVELASAYVSLRRSGRRYVGLCPFHTEKTPSFTVDRERGLFYCFGCGAGGDVFDFFMRVEGVSFPEALRELARRAGVPLEERLPVRGEVEALLRALDAAARFYRETLLHPSSGRVAREYLGQREITPQAADRFRLGYAPEAWDLLLQHLRRSGHAAEVLEKAGLVAPRGGGGHYDVFRHRLMFPILDLQDRPVAFGGRALREEDQPKYLNSRESPVFHKGRTLYALNFAREAIRQAGYAVVVEGYLDAVTCHQHGIQHTVASLGTALTPDQVALLRRFTASVVLVYDSDEAGQRAAVRALPLFEEAGLSVRAVTLPEGMDPDLFLRRHGRDAFLRVVEGARPVFHFRLDYLLRTHSPQTVEGKIRIVDELIPLLASYRHELARDEYLTQLVKRLGVPEEVVRHRAGALRPGKGGRRGDGVFDPARIALERASERPVVERYLLMLMLDDAVARERLLRELREEDFAGEVHREIFRALAQAVGDVHAARKALGEEARAALDRLIFGERPPIPDLEGGLLRLREVQRKERIAALVRELEEAQRSGDLGAVRRIQEELQRLRQDQPGKGI
ncbi:MAG: DNA primase [Armatimonadota bacterium]|nr:DNA primase [Armatimonadota bacterium]